MGREVVIASAARTAIGKFGGTLANVPVVELGSVVIKEVLKRAGIEGKDVDEVYMGCILQAAHGQSVARQSAVNAGIPVEVPALTLNNLCGSGLKCINIAASLIAGGEADVIVAGGMESMSGAAYALPNARFGYRMGHGNMLDTMIKDALTDAFNDYHMGITAENVAEKYNVTREEQDTFAALSQQKCEKAQAEDKFKEEIVPVEIKNRKETIVFDKDEYPRAGVTKESLAGMKPAFKKDGTVTAANASGINDGAAAVVLMSAEKAKELGVKPLARFVVGASAGVDPSVMGIGPVYSTRKALEKAKLTINDIDLIEANEAFAAQSVAVGKELGWNADIVNVNGGAIALGHPVGASGARIMVTLIHEMIKRDANRGLATLCVGGGMGVSAIIEKI